MEDRLASTRHLPRDEERDSHSGHGLRLQQTGCSYGPELHSGEDVGNFLNGGPQSAGPFWWI